MAYRVPFAALFLGALASAVPACGSDDSGGLSSGAPGPKLSELPAKLATTLCKETSECAGALWDVFLRGQDCVAMQTEAVEESDFSLLQAEVDAGRATYDPSKVDACLKAIDAAGCAVLSTRLSSLCDGLVVGKAAAGADCTINSDCGKGYFCKTDGTCPGACTVLQGVGKACTKSDACADGLTCSDASRTCIQPAMKDAPCGGAAAVECAFGLFCTGASNTETGTCKTVDSVFAGSEGGACSVTDTVYCTTGLSCALTGVDASNAAVWKCEKPSSDGNCHVGYPETCPDGQYCELGAASVNGKCKAYPADGAACAGHVPGDATDKKDICGVDSVCTSGVCKAVQHLSGACTTDAECVSKTCVSGKCLAAECAE